MGAPRSLVVGQTNRHCRGHCSLRCFDHLVAQSSAELCPGTIPLCVLRSSEQLGKHLRRSVLVQCRCGHELHCGDLCGAAAAAIRWMVEEDVAVGDEIILVVLAISHCDDAWLQLRNDERVIV